MSRLRIFMGRPLDTETPFTWGSSRKDVFKTCLLSKVSFSFMGITTTCSLSNPSFFVFMKSICLNTTTVQMIRITETAN